MSDIKYGIYYTSLIIYCAHISFISFSLPWAIVKRNSPVIKSRSLLLIIYQVAGMISLSTLFWLNLNGYMNCMWVTVIKTLLPDPIVAIIARCLRFSITYEATYKFLYGLDNVNFVKKIAIRISDYFVTVDTPDIKKERAIFCIVILQFTLSILPVVGTLNVLYKFGTIGPVFGTDFVEACKSVVLKTGGLFAYVIYVLFVIQLIIVLRNSQDVYMIKAEYKVMSLVVIVCGVPALVLANFEDIDIQNMGWTIATFGFLLIDIVTFIVPLCCIYNGSNDLPNEDARKKSYAKMENINIDSFFLEGGLKDDLKNYLIEQNDNQLIMKWKFWCEIKEFRLIPISGRPGKALIICNKYLADSPCRVDDEPPPGVKYVDPYKRIAVCARVGVYVVDASKSESTLIMPNNIFDEIYTLLCGHIEKDILLPYYESESFRRYFERKTIENKLHSII